MKSASFFADRRKYLITSSSNNQIKNVMNLLKKSGERKSRGLFVIEGIRMFTEIPQERIVKVFASESFANNNPILLCGFEYELVSDKVFSQMSDTKTPQGILAVVKMLTYSIEDMTTNGTPVIVVLENIQDPGNLGTIIRSAEGAGATGIIMSRDTVDIYNPKTIRSTMGALFRMPFLYSEDIINTVRQLKTRGIKLLAAHLDGENCYYNEDLSGAIALLIGNEGNGLTDELTNEADLLVKIPMEGNLESLNAAVSTAVILYEAHRQRNK